ncbi:hypothetical protein B4U80_12821 [Leptotrombidium deliense]|uniref:Uncharacterized protein n=1 Tax=Leptotrombidium deliense TaxID=299467 RepID=A0A443SKI9_9ACAR|nr:hypothetical protein B4U80_12821 [Leptotrombidium deliense]
MNSLQFLIAISILCSFTTDAFDCDTMANPYGGFRGINSDIYIFSKSGYLSKLKSFENGKWFRVYDNYPKFWKYWIRDDFSYFANDQVEYIFHGVSGGEVEFKTSKSKFLEGFHWNPYYVRYEFSSSRAPDRGSFRNCEIIKDTASAFGNKARRKCQTETSCFRVISETEVSENGTDLADVDYLKDSVSCDSIRHVASMIAFNTSEGSYGYSFQDQYSVPLYVLPKRPKRASTSFTILKTKFSDAIYVAYENDEFPDIPNDRKLIVHNKLWFGCPVIDCQGIFIDAATKISNQTVLIFAGKYIYEVSSINKKPNNPKTGKRYFHTPHDVEYIDAAFTDRTTGNITVIKNERIIVATPNIKYKWVFSPGEMNKECNGSVENAVFNLKLENFYMFCGNRRLGIVWAYRQTGEAITRKYISFINSNLPKSIDAAFTHPDNDDIILMKNNFAIRIESDKFFQQTSSITLSFREYFGCKNESFPNLFPENFAKSKYEHLTRPKKAEKEPDEGDVVSSDDNTIFYVIGILFIVFVALLVFVVIIYGKEKSLKRDSSLMNTKESKTTGMKKGTN